MRDAKGGDSASAGTAIRGRCSLKQLETGLGVVDAIDDALLQRGDRRAEDEPGLAMAAGELVELDEGDHLVAAERDRRQRRLGRIDGRVGRLGGGGTGGERERAEERQGSRRGHHPGKRRKVDPGRFLR
jgi:hypothetical protein